MRKLRLIAILTEGGKLAIVSCMLDDHANANTSEWNRRMLHAKQQFDNVLVVTTNIDVNKIIEMFMEEGQILSSDVELFKETT